MKKVLIPLCLLFLFAIFFNCTREEYNEHVIVFSPDSMVIDGNGEIRKLNFLSSTKATCSATSNEDWIKIYADSLGQTVRFDLVVAANTTANQRRGSITIKQGGAQKDIAVIQDKAVPVDPYLKVGNLSNTFPNVGGVASIRIESNVRWNIQKEEQVSWLDFKGNVSAGEGNAIVELVAQQNETVGEKRTAVLTVLLEENPEIKHSIVISQDCYSYVLQLSSDALTFNQQQNSKGEITICSSYKWELKNIPSWLKADKTKASAFMQEEVITFTTTEMNTSGQDRTAEVQISDGTVAIGTIRLTQRSEDIEWFALSTDNIRVSTIQDGDGSIENLYDNDPSTYFTTYWNSYDITVPQWITVDLGDKATQKICFQYTNRNKLDYVPSKVLLQVTEDEPTAHIWQQEGDAYTDSDRDWTTVATFEGEEWCPVKAGAESGLLMATASKKYRYWRFYVEKAKQNASYEADYPDAFCFQISELKVQLYK